MYNPRKQFEDARKAQRKPLATNDDFKTLAICAIASVLEALVHNAEEGSLIDAVYGISQNLHKLAEAVEDKQ